MWIAIQNAVGARQGVGGGPGPTPPPYTPPLDAYPADIAYSVRKLSSSYSGPCMEVERVVDSATLDIGFDSNGLLDTQAIIDFVVAGGGTQEARVRTWYDQTGNSRHARQTVGSEMSYIYGGGSIREANGKPVVDPIYGGDGLYSILGTYSTAANNTVFTVISPGVVGGSYVMSRISGAFTQGILGAGIEEPISGWNSNIDFGFGTTQYYRDGAFYGSGTTLQRNDIMQSVLSGRRIMGIGFTQSGLTEPLLKLGRDVASSIYATQEYIVYFSDQLGTVPRTALEGNINSYYQVANLPDYTSGLLADYSGAAAAYSVRKLSNTAIKCMRVRRTVAPFDELDIGFTPAGDLDEQAIVDFGGSDILVVSRWYDQSGFSRHAVQPTPGNQPQIYNGTAVITENGKPALKYDSGEILSTTFSNTAGWTNFAVCAPDANTNNSTLLHFDTSGGSDPLIRFSNAGVYRLYWTSFLNGASYTARQYSAFAYLAQDADFALNGATISEGSWATAPSATHIHIGAKSDSSIYWIGTIQEVIVYDSNESTNRTGIESNINDYYYVYNTSGFVVDYPGAIAAYSVRQLGNRQRYAMRVRRLGGAADYLDVGFVAGELDTQAIIDFGGSDTLGVEVWYDQSGSGNDVTNTSTTTMPIIYNGSSVITDGGKPALGRNSAGLFYQIPTGNIIPAGVTQASFISVLQGPDAGTLVRTWFGSGGGSTNQLTTGNNLYTYNGSTAQFGSGPAVGRTLGIQLTDSNPGAAEKGWRNGVLNYSADSGPNTPRTNVLGSATLASSPLFMQEMILYPTDIDAGGTRTNIETNIMTYYGIP